MGVKRKEIRGTAGVKSEATPSVQWRSGVSEFQRNTNSLSKEEISESLFTSTSGLAELER